MHVPAPGKCRARFRSSLLSARVKAKTGMDLPILRSAFSLAAFRTAREAQPGFSCLKQMLIALRATSSFVFLSSKLCKPTFVLS